MPSSPATDVFKHNVRMLMQDKGVTITQLATAVGISRPGISRLLSSEEGVTLERAERIARFFNMPLASLLTDKFENAGLTPP